MSKVIYADNAATTKVSDTVLNSMLPYLKECYGNPSSVYSMGRETRKAVEKSREQVANAIGATPQEIYFTSCATESNNWAIKGVLKHLAKKGKNHLITSKIEHHAVLHTANVLEKEGIEVTYVSVDEYGVVDLEELKNSIKENTALVSIMFANNEIGTIQPIKEIGEICKNANVLFHTDAVQAVGNVEIDVKVLNISLLSLSGHKFHAPKGVGALYIKKGVVVKNILDGGGQEKGKRPGTENVASIIGLGTAIEEATSNIKQKNEHLKSLTTKLCDNLLNIEQTRLNGHSENRLCNNVNISFKGIEGEGLLLMLDRKGLCASSGSACTSGSLDPSHVLMAIGLDHMTAHGSLRLSFSKYSTMQEIDEIIEIIPKVVALLRSMSPVWEQIKEKE